MRTDSYSQLGFNRDDFAILIDAENNNRFGVPIQIIEFLGEDAEVSVHFKQLGQKNKRILSEQLRLEYFASNAGNLAEFYRDYLQYLQEIADKGEVDAILQAATLFYTWAFRGTEDCMQAMGFALEYFQRASEQGAAEASYQLAEMYRRIINPDYDLYFQHHREKNLQYYLRQSAQQGHCIGQYQLAYSFEYGQHGFTQDDGKALYWYQQAADQDNPQALNNLGDKYERGKGVKRDYTQAAHYYQRSANHDIVEAIYNLGRLYLRGLGVEKDEVKGRALLTQAANRYYLPARRKLKSLDKK